MITITVRDASLAQKDDVRFVDFFNSQVRWLGSVGSGDQWTEEAVVDDDSPRYQKLKKWISQGEETVRDGRPFCKDWIRAYVAEVEIPDKSKLTDEQSRLCQNGRLPVCCMVLTGKASDYTIPVFSEQDEADPFVFLQLLSTDRRAGQYGRGSGAAMVEFAKQEVRKIGAKRLVGDCFGGNERRLIKFYEGCGFEVVTEFKTGEKNWPVPSNLLSYGERQTGKDSLCSIGRHIPLLIARKPMLRHAAPLSKPLTPTKRHVPKCVVATHMNSQSELLAGVYVPECSLTAAPPADSKSLVTWHTMKTLQTVLGIVALCSAQQIYIPTQGTTTRQCPTTQKPEPTYAFSDFRFTMNETVRMATSVPPASITQHYGPSATPLPGINYTTWGSWNPNATAKPSDGADPYGQAAWTGLWERANPPNFTETGLYSAVVEPTPIPAAELVLPPPDYFGPTDCYNFPDDFIFGVSGSAAQIEGATAEEGKGPTYLDLLIKTDAAKDYVTNENYYLYKQDIERLAAMGVKYYSFSIPWSRILPFALPGTPVNKQGIQHYDDLINFVLEKGMLPTVTLLHFDLPFQFYEGNLSAIGGMSPPFKYGRQIGGYQNETFADAFVNYAKIVMTQYSDRVPIWFTFNEPFQTPTYGASIDHIVKSHARIYHWYKEDLKGTGKIAIKFADNFGVPRDPSLEADVFAANWFNSYQLATIANPVYLGIDYPESYKEMTPDYIPLSAEDLAFINGTADFLGIDPYTATVITPPDHFTIQSIRACAANVTSEFRPNCVNSTTINRFGWDIGYRSQSYVYITPTYLREYLNYLWNTFKSPIAVTEFGFPVYAESEKALADQLYDTPRSIYYLSYMSEILKSIWEDNVHVVGAFAWSFMDNWEFGDYKQQFGIQVVNRTTKERHYKKSFFDLVDFVNARMPNQKS